MKIIALDLDGTLLNGEKVVSPRNYAALQAAAELGNWIVPATGRALKAIPDQVLLLPFVRYVISINGANVADIRQQQTLLCAEIPKKRALELIEFSARYDAMYDCYWQNTGWVDRDFLERVRYYNADEEVVQLIQKSRAPVENLRDFIQNRAETIQKVQLCFRDMDERSTAAGEIAAAFPDIAVTSSFRNNLELNWKNANKGNALHFLAEHLHISAADTIAFGDSSNDLAMLSAAGTSVAMGNAAPEVQAVCDYVTRSNEDDGVAVFLEQHLLG